MEELDLRELFELFWNNSTDEEKEKAEKNIMLKLISCIKERLAEINDGNFVVEDLETERLKNM